MIVGKFYKQLISQGLKNTGTPPIQWYQGCILSINSLFPSVDTFYNAGYHILKIHPPGR